MYCSSVEMSCGIREVSGLGEFNPRLGRFRAFVEAIMEESQQWDYNTGDYYRHRFGLVLFSDAKYRKNGAKLVAELVANGFPVMTTGQFHNPNSGNTIEMWAFPLTAEVFEKFKQLYQQWHTRKPRR